MDSDSDRPEAEREALAFDVWLDFLEREAIEDDAAFEGLCLRRPDLSDALRRQRARSRELPLEGPELPIGASPGRPIEEHLQRLSGALPAGARYEREGLIARGGMGAIYRVKDQQLERRLALKEMATGFARENALSAARFFEEAQVTSQLDHPGIVPVHECGVDAEGRLFFVMKLVHGRDLRKILDLVREGREGWTVTRALSVVLKVCEAMAYAHSKGVLHRDLKPGNVMVGHFGEVYVMDWGLARVMGRQDLHDLRLRPREETVSLHTHRRDQREETPDSPLVTMDGMVVGTPAYMSPEQACGEIERLSPRSDVYSVGAILYHLLAGATPYVPEGARLSKYTVLALVVNGPPTRLAELAPRAPAELVAICEKAMARDPERRYPDMLAMAEDLRAYLEGRVVKAHASGPVAELVKWVLRNKGFASATAAAILALIGGLGMSTKYSVEAAESASVALRESERANREALAAERRAAQVLRLSDLQILDDLIAEADRAWPVRPEDAPALEHWLARAHALLDELPAHERELAALASRDSEEDRWWRNQIEKLIAGVRALHDPATGLVAGLSADHGPGIEPRLAFARTIRERSIEGPEAVTRWRHAFLSIRDRSQCPEYGGLELRPQLGLLPIGQDPESRLWEFAHLASGAPATRGPDGKLVIEPDTGVVLVLIPGGTFWMGTQGSDPERPNYSPWAKGAQTPVHEESVSPCFLSKYELTQAQWERLAGSNPSENVRDESSALQPVELVSWIDCHEILGRFGLTLPTEQQWEYAARSGTTSTWWTGDDPESLEGVANLSDRRAWREDGSDSFAREEWLDDGSAWPSKVGSYLPNAFGLHDVHGNVAEWCLNAPNPETMGARVLRGGSWLSLAREATSALRIWWMSDSINWDLGVRPAMSLQD